MLPFYYAVDVPEDERIRVIGEACVNGRVRVGVLVDDAIGKADRYVSKLKERYPGIRVTHNQYGPFPGVVAIVVEPPVQSSN